MYEKGIIKERINLDIEVILIEIYNLIVIKSLKREWRCFWMFEYIITDVK